MPKQLTSEQLAELAKFDTPTICNAIELFDVRPRNLGYMDQRIRAEFPHLPPMVGYALTSGFRSQAAPKSGDVYGSIGAQLEAFSDIPGPPVLVFQDFDQPSAAATFGEVMCTTYKTFGAAGLITSGTGRDIDQVREIDFPIFTNGTVCAHGYCHILSINVPVSVGGMTVEPGALLHGDVNGVTTIPDEIAAEVADACAAIVEAEKIVLDYLKSKSVTVAGFNEARAACGAQIDEFAKQVRRN